MISIRSARPRAVLALALPVLVATAVIGCGGSDDAATGAVAAPATSSTVATQGRAAGETGAAAAQLEQLYQQAKATGGAQVNLYSVYTTLQSVLDAFNATYPGIKVVSSEQLWGALVLNRLKAEAKSGRHQGDAVLQDTSSAGAIGAAKQVVPFTPLTAKTLAADDSAPDGTWHRPFNTYNGVVWNTTLVTDEDVPKTISDLFTDRWKGKFAYEQPSGFELTDIVLATLARNKRIDEATIKRIKEYGKPVKSVNEAVAQTAQGQIELTLWGPATQAAIAADQGAPIKSATLGDATFYQAGAVGLLKDSPHPAAAKLFIAWLFSKAGQQALAAANAYGTVPGSPTPVGFPDLAPFTLKPIPFATADQITSTYYEQVTKPVFGPPLQ